jgi:hypothetical protein
MDDADLERVLEALPVEALERLRPRYFTDNTLRRRRLEQRDDAIRALAADGAASGREMAAAIEAELRQYGEAGWRFERGRAPPPDLRHALRHRVLTLCRGKAPGLSIVTRALAGLGPMHGASVAVAKSAPQMHQQPCDAATVEITEDQHATTQTASERRPDGE